MAKCEQISRGSRTVTAVGRGKSPTNVNHKVETQHFLNRRNVTTDCNSNTIAACGNRSNSSAIPSHMSSPTSASILSHHVVFVREVFGSSCLPEKKQTQFARLVGSSLGVDFNHFRC